MPRFIVLDREHRGCIPLRRIRPSVLLPWDRRCLPGKSLQGTATYISGMMLWSAADFVNDALRGWPQPRRSVPCCRINFGQAEVDKQKFLTLIPVFKDGTDRYRCCERAGSRRKPLSAVPSSPRCCGLRRIGDNAEIDDRPATRRRYRSSLPLPACRAGLHPG